MNRRRLDAASGELVAREVVDRDVTPRRLVARGRFVSPLRTLPGEVVVVEDGPTPIEDLVERVACGDVEGQRDDVLDHDDVRVLEHRRQVAAFEERRRVHREFGYDDVADAVARTRGDVVPERAQRGYPFRRFDAHAIARAESIAHDDEAGHGPRLEGEPTIGR